MSAPIKHLADLQHLHARLKAEEEQRLIAEAERKRLEAQRLLEADLFRRSIGDITPLPAIGKAVLPVTPPPPVARQHHADEQAALQESLSDEFTYETLLDTDENLSYVRQGVGQDVLRRLRRGQWVIQGQLDLHGLRRDEAREALSAYIKQSVKRGLRCVRIIHGKGLGSVNKEPVLKNKVRNWLVQKDEVIAFCQARANDGGAGALIVLLRAGG